MICLILSVTFVNGLYSQTSLAVNCLPADYHTYMRKNHRLENYLKKKILYFHIQEILSHSRELGSISGTLPDDPGRFTCMVFYSILAILVTPSGGECAILALKC